MIDGTERFSGKMIEDEGLTGIGSSHDGNEEEGFFIQLRNEFLFEQGVPILVFGGCHTADFGELPERFKKTIEFQYGLGILGKLHVK